MMFTEEQIGESCSYVFKMLNPEEDKKVLKSLFQFSRNISGGGAQRGYEREVFGEACEIYV